MTDRSCNYTPEGMNHLDLSQFDHLIEFAWAGVQSKDDFAALCDHLRLNAQHLKSLSLDLVDWEKVDNFGLRITAAILEMVAAPLISLRPTLWALGWPGQDYLFPSLEILSLSALSFQSAINEISESLNFSGLRKLRLWNCNGTFDLLDQIVDSQQVIRLTSLEIVMGPLNRVMLEDGPTGRFLQAFSGLENFYISLPICKWDVIGNGDAGHAPTLKRIVLQRRTLNMDDESDTFGEEEESDIDWTIELDHLFVRTNCDVMGVANAPDYMVSFSYGP
jgi:hypothetical protein